MKYTLTLATVAAAGLAQAQGPGLPPGTKINCLKPNANFCQGGDIIIRCDANALGTPGRCSDNIAGEPPLGGVATCWQSSELAGDAACEKNCVVYASSSSFTLDSSMCSSTAYETETATDYYASTTTTPSSGYYGSTTTTPSSSYYASTTSSSSSCSTTSTSPSVYYTSSSTPASSVYYTTSQVWNTTAPGSTSAYTPPSTTVTTVTMGNTTFTTVCPVTTSTPGSVGTVSASHTPSAPSTVPNSTPSTASTSPTTIPTAAAAANRVGALLAVAGVVAAYMA